MGAVEKAHKAQAKEYEKVLKVCSQVRPEHGLTSFTNPGILLCIDHFEAP